MDNKLDFKFSFEKLDVWNKSRCFVSDIYKITRSFPKDEKFVLVDQIRRASISISSNLAEGSSRATYKDQAHYTSLAFSSTMEVLNQLYIALDLGYVKENEFNELKEKLSEITNLLNGLRKSQLSRS